MFACAFNTVPTPAYTEEAVAREKSWIVPDKVPMCQIMTPIPGISSVSLATPEEEAEHHRAAELGLQKCLHKGSHVFELFIAWGYVDSHFVSITHNRSTWAAQSQWITDISGNHVVDWAFMHEASDVHITFPINTFTPTGLLRSFRGFAGLAREFFSVTRDEEGVVTLTCTQACMLRYLPEYMSKWSAETGMRGYVGIEEGQQVTVHRPVPRTQYQLKEMPKVVYDEIDRECGGIHLHPSGMAPWAKYEENEPSEECKLWYTQHVYHRVHVQLVVQLQDGDEIMSRVLWEDILDAEKDFARMQARAMVTVKTSAGLLLAHPTSQLQLRCWPVYPLFAKGITFMMALPSTVTAQLEEVGSSRARRLTPGTS